MHTVIFLGRAIALMQRRLGWLRPHLAFRSAKLFLLTPIVALSPRALSVTSQGNVVAPQSTDKIHRLPPKFRSQQAILRVVRQHRAVLGVDPTACCGEYRLRSTNVPFASEPQARIDICATFCQHA